MASLNTSFTKATVQGGAPAQLNINYTTLAVRNLVIVERRQQSGIGYPILADAVEQVDFGGVKRGILALTFIAPSAVGTYKYTTKVVDDQANVVVTSDSILNILGSASAATEADSVNVSVGQVYQNYDTPIRVVYSSSVNGGLRLEWWVRLIRSDNVTVPTPVRIQQYGIDQYYVGDVQILFNIPESVGLYEWEWRVVNTTNNKILSTVKKQVQVLDAGSAPTNIPGLQGTTLPSASPSSSIVLSPPQPTVIEESTAGVTPIADSNALGLAVGVLLIAGVIGIIFIPGIGEGLEGITNPKQR